MTHTMITALQDDVEEHIVAAAEGYEFLLKQNPPVEAYLNLACLYWRSTDFGFASYYRLTDTFYLKAGEKCYEVLERAAEAFPECSEVIFWQRYFAWSERDVAFSDEECLRIAQMPSSSLVPFFRLYSPPECKYEKEALALLAEIQALPTIKNRYIIPILEKKLGSRKLVQ